MTTINITLKVVINDELDIFDIEVGDYIYIESDLLNINQKIRVLEYTVNIKENTVDVVLGNTIYRDNTVINYKYQEGLDNMAQKLYPVASDSVKYYTEDILNINKTFIRSKVIIDDVLKVSAQSPASMKIYVKSL